MKRKYRDIEYTLKRSSRKTASIYIERDAQVTVLVPETLDERKIVALLESKRKWIYTGLAEWHDLNATKVRREYVNGEGFLYLGRSYRLKLVSGQAEPLMLKDGYFCLRADNGSTPDADAAFKAYYRARGLLRIPERVAYFQPKMGVEPRGVKISKEYRRMDDIEKVVRSLEKKFPLVPHTNAGRLSSTVRRMKAEKEAGIPVSRRTGFAISVKRGKPANELDESQWDEFYSELCGQLKRDYPALYQQVFPDERHSEEKRGTSMA